MHTEPGSQNGASRWLVIVGVALMSGIAIAAWRWITPQHVANVPSVSTALPPLSIPTAKIKPGAEGRQAMAGSSASADIEQQVQRLADDSRRKSPDVSQFPVPDPDSDAWPAVQPETPAPVVAPEQQASVPEPRAAQAKAEPAPQVEAEPAPQVKAETTAQQPAREEAALSGEELDTLLAAARADLARDRLTTPAGENALERFRSVLAHDPGNEEATRGLHDIVTRYVALARRVAGDGRFDKAESFLQRAEQVGVGTDTLLEARQQLAEMRANR